MFDKRITIAKNFDNTDRRINMERNQIVVDGVEKLEEAIARVRRAQKEYATFTQEQVDKIFFAAATAANKMRIPLAKLAVEETGMGIVEDKVIKNHYASEYIYNAYRHTKTCGVLEEDKAYGTIKIAEPIGLVAAVIPTTNPTSTAIFKTLLALKTRNGIRSEEHTSELQSPCNLVCRLLLKKKKKERKLISIFVKIGSSHV